MSTKIWPSFVAVWVMEEPQWVSAPFDRVVSTDQHPAIGIQSSDHPFVEASCGEDQERAGL